MKSRDKKKFLALVPLVVFAFTFQNCGEEGFISQNGAADSFSSFEEVYPSMDSRGNVRAKYNPPKEKYRSREYIRANERIYEAIAFVPATYFPSTGGGDTSGIAGGTGVTSGGGQTLTVGGNPVPILDEAGFAGRVTNYYSGTFHYMKQATAAFASNESLLYPDRYYGEPARQELFEEQGLGIIRVDLRIGKQGTQKTEASFYQYKADYFRKKAVIFVLGDSLFSEAVGAGAITFNQQHLVKLAKKGYLVIHLKPKPLKIVQEDAGLNRCQGIEEGLYHGVNEVRAAVADVSRRADYFGLDKDKMFILGFGEGGTLAAYTAFLERSEAINKFGKSLVSVDGFEHKSLFKGVGISGGGVLDSSILNGKAKARVVTIHGGCDESVKVDGSEIYGCMKNSAQINPISSKAITDFMAGYEGGSASVLNCSSGADTTTFKSLDVQFGYFATYFHNIIGPKNATPFSHLSAGISSYYQSARYCHGGGRDDTPSCSFPIPLINDVVYGACKKGPCKPPPENDNG